MPPPTALADEGANTDFRLDVANGSQPAVRTTPAQPQKLSFAWFLLFNFAFLLGSLAAIWFALGDKLGLPSPSTAFGFAQNPPPPTTTDEIQPQRSAVSNEAELETPPTAPKLLSPSIEITEGQFLVDQVLDQQTSKPIGIKTIIDVGVKNLTGCQIVNIAFRLNCVKQDGKTITIDIDKVNFSRGLMPKSSGVLSLTCEPGNWDHVEVSIVSVESENESDLTLIGPFKIESDDRLSE